MVNTQGNYNIGLISLKAGESEVIWARNSPTFGWVPELTDRNFKYRCRERNAFTGK